jgi:hypothetical protein
MFWANPQLRIVKSGDGRNGGGRIWCESEASASAFACIIIMIREMNESAGEGNMLASWWTREAEQTRNFYCWIDWSVVWSDGEKKDKTNQVWSGGGAEQQTSLNWMCDDWLNGWMDGSREGHTNRTGYRKGWRGFAKRNRRTGWMCCLWISFLPSFLPSLACAAICSWWLLVVPWAQAAGGVVGWMNPVSGSGCGISTWARLGVGVACLAFKDYTSSRSEWMNGELMIYSKLETTSIYYLLFLPVLCSG